MPLAAVRRQRQKELPWSLPSFCGMFNLGPIELADPTYSGYISDIDGRREMSEPSQQRAIANFRKRLAEKGLVRFEVTGRDSDRELVRTVARRLAEAGPDSDRLRAAVNGFFGGEPPKKGGILKALLASPLIGSELDLNRPREEGRKVDL